MKRTATTALRFAGTSARPSTVALRHLVCAVLCVPSLSPSLRSPPPAISSSVPPQPPMLSCCCNTRGGEYVVIFVVVVLLLQEICAAALSLFKSSPHAATGRVWLLGPHQDLWATPRGVLCGEREGGERTHSSLLSSNLNLKGNLDDYTCACVQTRCQRAPTKTFSACLSALSRARAL
jgi:hypothetical protein